MLRLPKSNFTCNFSVPTPPDKRYIEHNGGAGHGQRQDELALQWVDCEGGNHQVARPQGHKDRDQYVHLKQVTDSTPVVFILLHTMFEGFFFIKMGVSIFRLYLKISIFFGQRALYKFIGYIKI